MSGFSWFRDGYVQGFEKHAKNLHDLILETVKKLGNPRSEHVTKDLEQALEKAYDAGVRYGREELKSELREKLTEHFNGMLRTVESNVQNVFEAYCPHCNTRDPECKSCKGTGKFSKI